MAPGAAQFKIELLPLATELGLAVKLMLGAADFTDTVTDWLTVFPSAVQARA